VKGEKTQMHRIISVYGRKIFSVALIFNALLTISFAIGLLWGLYVENWTLYSPYLINGNLFWLAIAAAIVNIFPAASVGKVHTGRLWFHHYVYGFFVMLIASIWTIFFTPESPLTMFFVNTSDVAITQVDSSSWVDSHYYSMTFQMFTDGRFVL
jgi:hypothetical protein